MWSALRKDFQEFVSTVAVDTSNVLSQMDNELDEQEQEQQQELLPNESYDPSPEEVEALRRMGLIETYSSPLLHIDPATNAIVEEDEQYVNRVNEFLESFHVEEKADEIAAMLEDYPDTLKKHLEILVPDQVSYEEFWQRHYFRCDMDRIAQEWNEDGEEKDNEEEGEDRGATNPIHALGSLWGGAVKAVSASLREDDDGDVLEEQQRPSIFQGARPPFVLNTAVDEDDDNGEELGWDDDEEDEEPESAEHEIEFKDEVMERMQEQLKLALVERDQLQETVHLQAKEIAALKTDSSTVSKAEVDHLRILLFEKESELAAMKTGQLDGSHPEDMSPSDARIQALEKEVARLTLETKKKDFELSEMKETLEKTKKQLEEAEQRIDSSSAEMDEMKKLVESGKAEFVQLTAEKTNLEAKLTGLGGSESQWLVKVRELEIAIESLTKEKVELERSLESTTDNAEAKLAAMRQELAQANDKSSHAAADLKTTAAALQTAEHRVTQLELELNHGVIKSPKEVVAGGSISPDTVSTGVKVDSPKAVKLATDEENDEWGDDWGDGENL